MATTRDRIVHAATRLFQMQGYHGTGMAALMQAADVRKSSLYHQFPNGKEEIALATLDWLSAQIIDRLDQMAASGAGGSAMTQEMIDRGVSMAGTDNALRGSLVAVLAWDCIPDQPTITARLREVINALSKRLVAGFEREGASDPETEARKALALIEGTMLLSRINATGN